MANQNDVVVKGNYDIAPLGCLCGHRSERHMPFPTELDCYWCSDCGMVCKPKDEQYMQDKLVERDKLIMDNKGVVVNGDKQHPPVVNVTAQHDDMIFDQLVKDALRTEPNYDMAAKRLQDIKLVRLLHVAMGLASESGEFVDQLKRHIYYGKPVDEVNLIEELGDSSWYERIGCDALEVKYRDMLQRNVAKLKARFPDKFTETDAVNRDLVRERAVLDVKR